LTNDQTAFADDTSTGYDVYDQVPTATGSYQKEIHPSADVFLPSVVTGGSSTTYLGDAFWIDNSIAWRVAIVGTSTGGGGVFTLDLRADSGLFTPNISSRLAYAEN
jgi:hypothetical protein